uniref:Uncharacterized protein n=1 Tax=Romanomermis culicivorax TaxID=13658 RepID=A0A915JGB3_ROMCU
HLWLVFICQSGNTSQDSGHYCRYYFCSVSIRASHWVPELPGYKMETITPVPAGTRLIEKLMRLSKLKSLSLDICLFHYTQLDDDLPYHGIMEDLYFVSLQNIHVDLRWPANHAAALKMMSSNSSLLGLDLYASQCPSLGSFDLILDQCPNLRSNKYWHAVQRKKLYKIYFFEHFSINYDGFCSDDIEKISQLRKLKFWINSLKCKKIPPSLEVKLEKDS